MRLFSEGELREAARAIASTRMKSEKAILKLKVDSPQRKITARGITAYSLALSLIARELGEAPETGAYSTEELVQAQEAFAFATTRVNSMLPKFTAGTPQHTLAVRRIRAFEIAGGLLGSERERL